MSAIFVKTAEPSAPAAGTPFLEKDWAIIRDVALAGFDWSNPDTHNVAGPVVGGALFNNLVSGGLTARLLPINNLSSFPEIAGGMLRTQGAVAVAGTLAINLPDSFTFDSDVRRALVTFWAKLPNSGYVANGLPGLIGSGTGAGANLQYTVFLICNASGVPTSLTYRVWGSSANIDAVISGATLAALLDGGLHQIGLGVEIANGVGTVTLYIDGDAVASGSGAMSALNVIGAAQLFQGAGGAPLTISGTNTLDAALGRPFAHDLTSRPDITFADILARDAQSADGFLS